MIKLFEIPKNAGNFARFINSSVLGDQTIDVLVLRDPYKRFWSATKTVVDEISLFGSFPFEESINMRTTYEGMNFTIESVVSQSLAMLSNTDYYVHLRPQSEIIGDKKFDEVIYVETLNEDVQSLLAKYNIETIDNFSMDRKLTVSPKERDDEAMNYLMNTPSVKSTLDTFYANDFLIYNDPSSLLK